MKSIKTCAVIMSVVDEATVEDMDWEPPLIYPKGVLEQAPDWATGFPEFLKYGTLTKDDRVIKLGPESFTWTVAYCWTKR